MTQGPSAESGPDTAKTIKSTVEAGRKEPRPPYESKVKTSERNRDLESGNDPETQKDDAERQKAVMEASRAIIARRLADGTKLIPQVTALLNSTDQSVRSDAVKTLRVIGADLLSREGNGDAAMRKANYEARVDILSNLARLATNEKEPKELVSAARQAALKITTAEEQKRLRALDSKLADSILGPEAPSADSKVKLPK